MKLRRKTKTVAALLACILGWAVWEFSPAQAVFAVASLGDPAKLATLGERGANPRLNKIVYWLDHARRRSSPPDATVRAAQFLNRTREPRASLVRESLLRNMQIAAELGLLTGENLEKLRRGHAAVITRGPYAGSAIDIDHIVPFSLAPEIGNELANLEMLPASVNRRKSNRVGPRQLAHAQRFFEAGLLSRESRQRVQGNAR